jgi:hypothetical protein
MEHHGFKFINSESITRELETLLYTTPSGRIYASEEVDPFEKCCYRSCTAVLENSKSIDSKL